MRRFISPAELLTVSLFIASGVVGLVVGGLV